MGIFKVDERGGVGFVIFIVMFLLYTIISIVYFEAIQAEPPVEPVADQSQLAGAPQEKGPEITLPEGTVIEYPDSDLLVLSTNEDVSILPEDTPSRFVNFLSNSLPSSREETRPGCASAYQISKISNFNMSGSIGEVDVNTERSTDRCSKGLSVVWYVDQTNWTWVSKNFGVLPYCDELIDLPIYSEFIAECQQRDTGATNENPNGSIKNREG